MGPGAKDTGGSAARSILRLSTLGLFVELVLLNLHLAHFPRLGNQEIANRRAPDSM